MEVSFDPAKRQVTLEQRGLDFADAAQIFEGPQLTLEDDRFDYPEPRFQTYGLMNDRLVMLVWTPASHGIRVISMRKCNERERKAFAARLG
ncbi:MAG TPA: BrnT family toxin [Sphingobium sp.]|nr:BrnT family toxin [Sphingobium sp.]